MAASKLRRYQIKRIKAWQKDTNEDLDAGYESALYDKHPFSPDEHDEIDASKLRFVRKTESAFVKAPEMEEGGIDFREQHTTSKTLRKWFKKGAKVAFAPVSLPVRAILYGQKHWEDFFWTNLEKAVQRLEDISTSTLLSTHTKSNSETFQIKFTSPGGSSVWTLSAPPSPAFVAIPHDSANLAILRSLEVVPLEYSYLPLDHALNTESSRVTEEEPLTSPRTNGTFSPTTYCEKSLKHQLGETLPM